MKIIRCHCSAEFEIPTRRGALPLDCSPECKKARKARERTAARAAARGAAPTPPRPAFVPSPARTAVVSSPTPDPRPGESFEEYEERMRVFCERFGLPSIEEVTIPAYDPSRPSQASRDLYARSKARERSRAAFTETQERTRPADDVRRAADPDDDPRRAPGYREERDFEATLDSWTARDVASVEKDDALRWIMENSPDDAGDFPRAPYSAPRGVLGSRD